MRRVTSILGVLLLATAACSASTHSTSQPASDSERSRTPLPETTRAREVITAVGACPRTREGVGSADVPLAIEWLLGRNERVAEPESESVTGYTANEHPNRAVVSLIQACGTQVVDAVVVVGVTSNLRTGGVDWFFVARTPHGWTLMGEYI